MATQKIDDDEYGVEVIRAPTTTAAAAAATTAQTAAAPEETKTAAAAATTQAQPAAAAAAKPKPSAPAAGNDDSEDEEAMYGQGVDIAGKQEENDGFQVEEGKQMTETLVVFDRNQFVLYDFKSNSSWQVGDVENDSIVIPEDSSIIMIDNQKHRTNLC